MSTQALCYTLFRLTSKTNHGQTQLMGKNVMYNINIIHNRMCMCYIGTPRVHPVNHEFLHIPIVVTRLGDSFSGIVRHKSKQQHATFSRPFSDLPHRHRHSNGGRLSTPNKVILISYLVLCIVLLLHDRCVSSGRSVHYANRFPEDTSKGIKRNPSCSSPRRCATALHGGVHRRCPHTRARKHKNEGVELD